MSDSLWTIRDLATFLNLPIEAVRMMRKRGQIPPACVVKVGRRLRFIPDRVREWVGVQIPKRMAQ